MMQHRRRMLMNVASALPPKDTLENTSWADIAIVAAAGKASEYWAVNDTKTIAFGSAVFGSTSITVKIMGFGYDDLADGSGKAPITFGMVDCFATTQRMNATSTNAGGWRDCEMRTTITNAVLPALQTAIGANVIKPVNKRTGAGSGSSTIYTTSDSVWLFSEYEAFGTNSISVAGEKPTDKSIRYPAFTNDASRKKMVDSSYANWWMRSPATTAYAYFVAVNSSGAANGYTYATITCGVAVGFCV